MARTPARRGDRSLAHEKCVQCTNSSQPGGSPLLQKFEQAVPVTKIQIHLPMAEEHQQTVTGLGGGFRISGALADRDKARVSQGKKRPEKGPGGAAPGKKPRCSDTPRWVSV